MAATGDLAYSGNAAGYSHINSARRASQRPEIKKAIIEREQAALVNELLPASNTVLRKALDMDTQGVPWGSRLKAVEIVRKGVFGDLKDGGLVKELNEMTADELVAEIDRIKGALADKADNAKLINGSVQQENSPKQSIFD